MASRPTHGRIPADGVMPLAQDFDTVGVLAREPEVLQRAARLLLGNRPTGASLPSRLLLSSVLLAAADPEVAEAGRAAAHDLGGKLNAEVADTQLLDEAPSPAEGMAAFNVLQGAQVCRNYGEWVERRSPSLGADIAARIDRAAGFGPKDIARAQPVAHAMVAAVARLGSNEVLVLPTTGTAAPPRQADADQRERARVSAGQLTSIATLAAAPAISMPMLSPGGLPVGISLVGPPGSDLSLLAAASAARAGPS